DGWRQEDIAEILEVPIGTIKSRLHRVRALVRTKFQERLEPFEEQLRDSH
ncbi:MAG: RNA polymerase sigma factor, partial [Gammaproteobacteria bacterium]